MDRGITEENFFQINQSINEACEMLSQATAKEEPNKEELANINGQLLINASMLLEDSEGFIQTENPEFTEQFKRLLNAASGYKRYSMEASHHRRLIADALKNGNDEELFNASSDLKITNAFLRKYLNDLTTISKEIEEHKTNKK